jgi:Polysaccharide deacetylase
LGLVPAPTRRRARREARRRRGLALVLALVSALVGAVVLEALSSGGPRAPAPLAPRSPKARHVPFRVRLTVRERHALDRVMRYTPYIVVGGSRRREIALTFDDGRRPFTLRVLRSLRRLRAPATFFQVGQSIPTFRSAARAELRERYPIGDHTQNHVPSPSLVSAISAANC